MAGKLNLLKAEGFTTPVCHEYGRHGAHIHIGFQFHNRRPIGRQPFIDIVESLLKGDSCVSGREKMH